MTKYIPPPTRLGETFKAMVQTCPMEIASYGKCIATNADHIERGICDREFQALKICMRKVRASRK